MIASQISPTVQWAPVGWRCPSSLARGDHSLVRGFWTMCTWPGSSRSFSMKGSVTVIEML